MTPIFLPEKCPHQKAWEECCFEELLKANPDLKREDIVFSKHFGWVETKGHTT